MMKTGFYPTTEGIELYGYKINVLQKVEDGSYYPMLQYEGSDSGSLIQTMIGKWYRDMSELLNTIQSYQQISYEEAVCRRAKDRLRFSLLEQIRSDPLSYIDDNKYGILAREYAKCLI